MARYISTLSHEADLYCNQEIGKVCNVALSIFPRLMREFDFDMIAYPPETSYTRKDKLDTTLALSINRDELSTAVPNPHQLAFQVRASKDEDNEALNCTTLRTDNRGRINTVNIYPEKDFDWKTPNIITQIHKGLSWLVGLQLSQDRRVFFSQDSLHYYFTTTLHTLNVDGETYNIELRIVLFQSAFYIKLKS